MVTAQEVRGATHKVLAIEGPEGHILPLLDVPSGAVVHQHVPEDVACSLLHLHWAPNGGAAAQHTRLHSHPPVNTCSAAEMRSCKNNYRGEDADRTCL